MTDETNQPTEQAPVDPNPQAAGATSETAATDSTSGTTASSTGTPSVTNLDPVDPNVAGVVVGSTAPPTPATDAPGATLTTGAADAPNVVSGAPTVDGLLTAQPLSVASTSAPAPQDAVFSTAPSQPASVISAVDSGNEQPTGQSASLASSTAQTSFVSSVNVDPNESPLVTTPADMSAQLATKSKHGTAVDLEMHLKAEIAKLIGWPAHLEHAAKAFFDGLHSHIDNEAAK